MLRFLSTGALVLISMTQATAAYAVPEPCNTAIADARRSRANTAFYVMCVHVPGMDESAEFSTYLVGPEKDAVKDVGRTLYVNREVVLVVWHPTGSTVGATFGANALGWSSTVSNPYGVAAAKFSNTDMSKQTFAAVLHGEQTLTVTLTQGNKSFPSTYLVRVGRIFTGAVRVGLGIIWSPFERELALRDGPSAGAGQRVSVVAGADSGIFEPNLTLGYTHFFGERLEFEHTIETGLYAGVGVVEWGSKTRILTGTFVGAEVAFGHYASVVLMVGARWYDRPRSEFVVGRPPPAGVTEIETTFGVTPAFGVIINLPAGFFEMLSKVAGYTTAGS